MVRSSMGEVARSSLEGIHYPPLTVLEVIKVSLQYRDRTDTGFRCCAGRPRDDLLRLGFKQFSFHQTMRVLQGIAFSIFSTILALRACSCPLWVSPLGKLLTLKPSSKFYPSETGIPCRMTRRTRLPEDGRETA